MCPMQSVFKAYDVRATYPNPLNEDKAWKIGVGVGQYLQQHYGQGKVAVSHDHREMAPAMTESLIAGILSTGADVVMLGQADTSIQYFAIDHLGAIGGVQCTASHNPKEYIGFKISGKGALPIGRESGLQAIQEIAQLQSGDCPAAVGMLEQADVWAAYRQHVLRFMGELGRPMRVFVDASNGCGGVLVEKIFSDVPHLTVESINTRMGLPWAHEPNPMLPEGIDPTSEGVIAGEFDLGAAFDGDADRCMLVDENGKPVPCDLLTAALAGHFLQQHPGASIGYDLRSSRSAKDAIVAAGGTPVECKVGHVNIKAALRETGAVFAGELSGHFYYKDNACCDSGAITLAIVLGWLSRQDQEVGLSTLIAAHHSYAHSGECNFEIEDKEAALNVIEQTYGDKGRVFDLDGKTIDAWENHGYWFNVRASNTEPLLRLNAEAKNEALLQTLLKALAPMLGTPVSGH